MDQELQKNNPLRYLSFVPLRVFSFGAGVQSTAALALAAQGVLSYDAFLFANVGDDSENPETLQYLHEYALPFAKRHGLVLYEVHRAGQTLYQHMTRPGNTFAGIPMRLSNGKPGKRACTESYKIEVIDDWLIAYGGVGQMLMQERIRTRDVLRILAQDGIKGRAAKASAREVVREALYPLATVALGISLDEFQRASNRSSQPWKAMEYPLLDRRLTRADCIAIIRQTGLPEPPPSRCWFCPFQTLEQWRTLQHERPDRFEDIAQFEDTFNRGRRSKMWLTRKHIPLRQVVQGARAQEDPQDFCESGHCWT